MARGRQLHDISTFRFLVHTYIHPHASRCPLAEGLTQSRSQKMGARTFISVFFISL